MLTAPLSVVYFGKVPTHGDFVRLNASGAAMQAMDAWVQQGLYAAKSRLNTGFDDAFGAMGPCPFVFVPRDAGQLLVGVIGPSRDSVGRRYPFLVAFEADAAAFDAREIVHIPVRYHAFFEEATALVREATAGNVDYQQLAVRAERLSPLVGRDESSAFFWHYLQRNSLSSFWERLWGDAEDSRKYLLFKNLLDILEPLRNGVPSGYPLVLRFPLGLDGKVPDYDACIWLDVSLCLLGFADLRPSFFWSQPAEATGVVPQLLLALRSPSARLLSNLIASDKDDHTLCVLEQLGGQSAALAALSIPARYGRLLESDEASLWDFLQELGL